MTENATPRALVTGATAGIGNAYVRQLAKARYDLVIVARDGNRLTSIANDIRGKYGIDVEVLPADLTNEADLSKVSARVRATEKPISLVVNNAGSSNAGWFGTTPISEEDHQLDLLVRAPMHLMDSGIKAMSARNATGTRPSFPQGVINVASVAAFTPRGAYSAHKAWLVNLSQWANLQYEPEGITVQAVCPGFTRTEFHQRMHADISGIPRWMWLKADSVVKASLKDLEKGKAVSIPSVRYKILAFFARNAPSGLVKTFAKRGR